MGKKPANQPKLLSPENYIRQKSRNLPIIECYINKDWKVAKICSIYILRQHANGNVTFCMYLVDLGCLGVKDTAYKFNTTYEDVENLLERSEMGSLVLTKTSYDLVHNIIYASIEYAAEYGINPCKDFTSVTKYFLEEDTDAIPLIKVKCGGKNGKPIYINTGFDSPAREKQILAQLEKTAGKDNYDYIIDFDGNDFFDDDDDDEFDDDDEDFDDEDFDDDDEDFDDDDDFDDEDDEEEDEEDEEDVEFDDEDDEEDEDDEYEKYANALQVLSKEEQKKMFLALYNAATPNNIENNMPLTVLSFNIADDMIDEDEVGELIKKFKNTFDMNFVEISERPNSLLTGVVIDDDMTLILSFAKVIAAISGESNPKKDIANFRKIAGDTPISDFIELLYIQKKGGESFVKKVKDCYRKYPDYLLFQLYYFFDIKQKENKLEPKFFEDLLKNCKLAITNFEADFFFTIYTHILFDDDKTGFAEMEAYMDFACMYDVISPVSFEAIDRTFTVAKIKKVYDSLM